MKKQELSYPGESVHAARSPVEVVPEDLILETLSPSELLAVMLLLLLVVVTTPPSDIMETLSARLLPAMVV